MKKFLLALVMLVCLFAFTACGSNAGTQEDTDTKKQDSLTVTDIPDDTPAPTETVTTPEPTSVTTPEVTAEPTPEPTDIPVDTPAPTEIPADPVELYIESLTPVFEAYNATLASFSENSESDYYMTHFTLGYIDEDEIPELFVSYADYHAAGIKVFTYNPIEETVVDLGEFGSYGAMSYRKAENYITSFYMGMGYEMFCVTKIENYSQKQIISIEYDSNTDTYSVNNDTVDSEEYKKQMAAYENTEETRNLVTTSFEDEYPYYLAADNINFFAEIIRADFNGTVYAPFDNENFKSLDGTWSLVSASMTDSATGETITSDDAEIATAEVYVFPVSGYAGMWLHFNGDFFEEYMMPLEYKDERLDEIEGIGNWYSVLHSSDPNFSCVIAPILANDGSVASVFMRVIALSSDTDTKTYDIFLAKETEDEPDELIYGTITYDDIASEPDNGVAAFKCVEFIYVTPDDTELISQYNLAPDLDGYDYETVSLDDSAYTLYLVNTDTSSPIYEILDFSEGLGTRPVSFDELIDYINNEHFGTISVRFSIDGTYNGCPLIKSISEEYTG